MTVWIIAVALIILLIIFGYTHGVIKMVITGIGLLVGCMFAMPFSSLLYPIFSLAKIYNPIILWTVSPLIIILGFSVVSATVATVVSNKVEAHFRHHVPDFKKVLWDRLNQRLGIFASMINAFIYFILICVVGYVLGYPAYQLSSGDQDRTMFRMLVGFYEDLAKTKMNVVAAAFDPAPPKYYAWSDMLGILYHNPHLWERAGKYPPIMALSEKPEFQDILKDEALVAKFKNRESIQSLFSEPKVQAIITNSIFTAELLKIDLKDFTNYLHTGQTDKFPELILGNWVFDLKATLVKLRQSKPKMSRIEAILLERSYSTNIQSARLTALIDKNIILRITDTRNNLQIFKGTWEKSGAGTYRVTWQGGNISREIEIEPDRLILRKDNKLMIFEAEY
ncbi:MAG: hypothetical protein ACP5MG_11925 [Verrucomicrobiia bacterium]